MPGRMERLVIQSDGIFKFLETFEYDSTGKVQKYTSSDSWIDPEVTIALADINEEIPNTPFKKLVNY